MNTLEARIAFVNSQAVCALAEIEGMKAENEHRVQCGNSIAYGMEAFLAVPEKYGLGHNTVIAYLRDFS